MLIDLRPFFYCGKCRYSLATYYTTLHPIQTCSEALRVNSGQLWQTLVTFQLIFIVAS